MPCRLQPYIWISDDVLAAAYRRWANASLVGHAHSNTRRHGSSVPGPLEARRRLARRRMVGLAMSGPPSSPMPDFGALFGSAGFDLTSLWSPPTNTSSRTSNPPPPPPSSLYEPHPSLLGQPPPPDPPLSVDDYSRLLGECDSLASIHRAHSRLHAHPDLPVDFSKAAFCCLLKNASDDQLLHFLQSDLNHEDAHNTRRYLQHLFATKLHHTLLTQYMDLVCDKIALGTLSKSELIQIIDDLRHAPKSAFHYRFRRLALVDAYRLLRLSLTEAYAPKAPPYQITNKLLHAMCSLGPLPELVEHVFAVLAWVPSQNQRDALSVLARCLNDGIIQRTKSLAPSDLLSPFLKAIPPKHIDVVVPLATRRFIEYCNNPNAPDEVLENDNVFKRLLCWLHDLQEFLPRVLRPLSSTADVLYPLLARNYAPYDLGALFRSLSPTDATTVMLHYWVKPTILEGLGPGMETEAEAETEVPSTYQLIPAQLPPPVRSRRAATPEGPFPTYGITYTISRSPKRAKAHHASAEERQRLFGKVASNLQRRLTSGGPDGFPSPGGAFVHLFALLSRNKIEYTYWLDEVFQVLKSHKSPTWTYYFFSKLGSFNVPIPYPVASRLIQFFIDIGKPDWALDVFYRPDSTQWLSTVPGLVFAFIDRYPVKSEFLFRMLNQPDYANSLPQELRSGIKNLLSSERVQLVHHMAYALAKSPHLSSGMAFRRVTDCLNYLNDRNAPMSSMMSRALVFAGVTRPLREGRWLSTVRFNWILNFVRELEGEEVAQNLDEAAFAIRSENFELNRVQNRTLENMEEEADLTAWEYRKQFGHHSHRWKRKTRPLRLSANGRRVRV